MENLVLIIDIVLAILLIGSVLLQKSEGGALGLGASQESFVSSRSAGSFLTKTTAIIASLFIVTSILLTIMSKENLPTKSVLESVDEQKTSSEPEIPKSD
jgi:preprotein translocase subunit SecG